MGWLIGAIVVFALIYFMILSAGFRYIVFGLIAVGTIAIISGNEKSSKEAEQKAKLDAEQSAIIAKRRDEYELKSKDLVKASELLFTNLTLKSSFGDGWLFAGTVQNKSAYPLDSIDFFLSIQDCAAACVTIGESKALASYMGVPAGQARAFSANASFPALPAAQNQKWLFKVMSTHGTPPGMKAPDLLESFLR